MSDEELADYYDGTDMSAEIERARWDTEVEPDPMVVTSLRLPKSLLDWIRAEAASERVRPTALIRRWLEDQQAAARPRDGSVDLTQLIARVDRLESVTLGVARTTRAAEQDDPTGMAELLAALQHSVDEARRPPDPGTEEHRRGA